MVRCFFGIRGSAPVCILVIRGGIGNQLSQLAALSYLARNFGCVPIVNDYDLSLSSRDRYQSQFRRLKLSDWFDTSNNLLLPNNFIQKKFLNLIWHYTASSKIISCISDEELKSISSTHDSLNNIYFMGLESLFFMNGSFQNPKYALDLPPFDTQLFLKVDEEYFEDAIRANKEIVAIHVRLTDFTNDYVEYQENIQTGLNIIGNEFNHFDWYTDDLQISKQILSSVKVAPNSIFQFPDEISEFDGYTLLKKLSAYRNYIPSQSSICWWAFFLAQNCGLQPRIFAEKGKFPDFTFRRTPHVKS